MTLPDLARAAARLLAASPRRVAAAVGLATLLALAALADAPGVSRDEAAVIAAAGGAARAQATPPLAAALARVGHAAGAPLGAGHLRSHRLGAAIAGALLSVLLAAGAWSFAGPAGALLAPLLFWLAPRHLHAGLVATPEIALAALALAAVLAWRRAAAAQGAGARLRAAAAGLLLGAAVLARADAWTLLAALALHAAIVRALGGHDDAASRGGGVLAALGLASAAAAAVVLVAWPGARSAGLGPWLPPGGAGPVSAALVPLLAIPATLLLALAAGVAHAALRAGRAIRSRAVAGVSDDLLLLLAAAAAFAGSALAHAPPGARPWLHAVPFLALLGARALLRAATLAWPAREGPLAAALALLVLYPGLRAAVVAYPSGTSAWNELAGGAPGAASRGLARQDGGDAAAAALRAVSERARPGALIWWPSATPEAIALYVRDGRLREDLTAAAGPEDADVVVIARVGASRDAEYRAWTALRTARPAAGVYLDEVPLVLVYARAGAWR